MSGPDCTHADAPAGAKFCPECGTTIARPAPPRDVTIDVRQDVGNAGLGGVTGVSVGTVKGGVTVVTGNVMHIENPTPDLIAQLTAMKAVSTEVRAEPVPSEVSAARLHALEEQMSALLAQVQAAEDAGEAIEQVEAGGVRLSRVDLLLKQAVLLQAEADQVFFDLLEDNRPALERWRSGDTASVSEADAAAAAARFDEAGRQEKMHRALALLEEAQALEPTNAEVMLHRARIMPMLDRPDREVQRLLYNAKQLLANPRDDVERFNLAQATFLSAQVGDEIDAAQLRVARDMFARLGRASWVEQCDLLLGERNGAHADPRATAHGPPCANGPAHAGFPPGQPGFPAQPTGFAPHAPAPGFQPAGNWHAQVSSGSSMSFHLAPNGALQGVQQLPLYNAQVPFFGQWSFNPHPPVLYLQGSVNGTTPFALYLQVQQQNGDIFGCLGSDGLVYVLRRA